MFLFNLFKKKKKKIKKGDLRFNYQHKHIAHVKKVNKKKTGKNITSVFLSTKATDEGKENIPMKKPVKFGKKESSYFMKRVRSFNESSFSDKLPNAKLSRQDKKTSNRIYKQYLKNKKSR